MEKFAGGQAASIAIADAAYDARQRLNQFIFAEARIEYPREAAAVASAAHHQHVVVLAVARDADFGGRRSRTSVGASGHPDHHVDLAQPRAFELREIAWQRKLGMRHRETAGRLRRACDREPLKRH